MQTAIIPEGKVIEKVKFNFSELSESIIAYETLQCGFWKWIGRKIIQFSTLGRFEHIAGIFQATSQFDGEFWSSKYSRTSKVLIEQGKFFSYEATQAYGLNIMNFKDRIFRPSLDESKWGGYVYLLKFNERKIKDGAIDIMIEFLNKHNKEKKQYELLSAIISQFPDKLANYLHKKFKTKPRPQSFCSNLAISCANILFDIGLTPEQCQLKTPQEAIDFLRNNDFIYDEEKLCRFDYKRGLIEYNPKYINVDYK